MGCGPASTTRASPAPLRCPSFRSPTCWRRSVRRRLRVADPPVTTLRPSRCVSWSSTMASRRNDRAVDAMRAVRFTRHYTRHAEGSVLVDCGDTRVLCTATVEDGVPAFLRGKGQGWVTAEYGMPPRATHTRTAREAARGKQTGRTQEIQRLIGRSLPAVADLRALGERPAATDGDVPQAGSRSPT